uniref:Uncharacterized protein n=1 Tax=Siphoviridae sp. cttG32 TaxID=2825705 RepID=A0A8S5U4Z8_9CAUD|nr:MAG TPA: hypothetical protein [Siphoviridae sp. cttG32]
MGFNNNKEYRRGVGCRPCFGGFCKGSWEKTPP